MMPSLPVNLHEYEPLARERMSPAVAGRAPVLFDGGVRRGVDVVKALSLGATAVMIGRPYLWGLGAAGADGVARVVRLLATELEMAMAQCGARTLAELTPDLIWSR